MTEQSGDGIVGAVAVVGELTSSQGRLVSAPFTVDRPYLNFRISGGDYEYRSCLNVLVGGVVVRTETGRGTELPHDATLDLTEWLGAEACLEIVDVQVSDIALSTTPLVSSVPTELYREALRPQLHFTARQWAMQRLNPAEREEGWLNDLNGLVFHDGEYHLFAQRWNKCWIHAVSNDLVHWTELAPAFFEESLDSGVQSGSCVVDVDNTSGLGAGAMVAFWSRNDNRSQCVSYSLDRGRTWTHYAGNPILDLPERDPMVFRDHAQAQWVMVLYGDDRYHLLRSDDLLHWESLDSPVADSFECPDFFELPITGTDETRWVLVRGDGRYSVGRFDGRSFVEETAQLQVDGGPHFYATQSWSGTPGRRVQVAWMRGGRYPNMPFNQQVSIPCDLSLHRTAAGLRLYRTPVPELARLERRRHSWSGRELSEPWRIGTAWPLLRITCDVRLTGELMLDICGTRVFATPTGIALLDAERPTLTPLTRLDIIVDTTSVEVFANDGEASLTACVLPGHLELTLTGTGCTIVQLDVAELDSIWR